MISLGSPKVSEKLGLCWNFSGITYFCFNFKLQRAVVRSPETGEYVTADYRISKSGWLNDLAHPHLRYLTKLVNSITNLSLDTAEEWQVCIYNVNIFAFF
jgi:hypothetical protein